MNDRNGPRVPGSTKLRVEAQHRRAVVQAHVLDVFSQASVHDPAKSRGNHIIIKQVEVTQPS